MDEAIHELREFCAEIVSAYVSKHRLSANELPDLIRSVYEGLAGVTQTAKAEPEAVATPLTKSQIRKSVTENGLVSFEDGKIYQTLKRHLATRGMTVEEYKNKWGLPPDYPTTSPAYATKRSELAKAAGLGRGGRGGEFKGDSPGGADPEEAGHAAVAPNQEELSTTDQELVKLAKPDF